MRKAFSFIKSLYEKAMSDDLTMLANELTYKLLLALFPFIIFAMSLIGFFNLDGYGLLNELGGALPDEIAKLLEVFVSEVVMEKSAGILSTSIIVATFNATTGFRAIIRGINKAYGAKEGRGIISSYAVSFLLTLIFIAVLVVSAVLFLFRDAIKKYAVANGLYSASIHALMGAAGYAAAVFILLLAVALINKLSVREKIALKNILPGAAATVAAWLIAGRAFNIYINNFAKFSRIYGSIAGIFILLLWLNINAYALLIGSEINGILAKGYGL